MGQTIAKRMTLQTTAKRAAWATTSAKALPVILTLTTTKMTPLPRNLLLPQAPSQNHNTTNPTTTNMATGAKTTPQAPAYLIQGIIDIRYENKSKNFSDASPNHWILITSLLKL